MQHVASLFSTSRLQWDFLSWGALKAWWWSVFPNHCHAFKEVSLYGGWEGGHVSTISSHCTSRGIACSRGKHPKKKKISLWLQKHFHPERSDLGQYSGEFLIKWIRNFPQNSNPKPLLSATEIALHPPRPFLRFCTLACSLFAHLPPHFLPCNKIYYWVILHGILALSQSRCWQKC